MINEKRCIIEQLKLYESVYEDTKHQKLIHTNHTLNEAVENIMIKPEGKKAMERKEFLNGYLR